MLLTKNPHKAGTVTPRVCVKRIEVTTYIDCTIVGSNCFLFVVSFVITFFITNVKTKKCINCKKNA